MDLYTRCSRLSWDIPLQNRGVQSLTGESAEAPEDIFNSTSCARHARRHRQFYIVRS